MRQFTGYFLLSLALLYLTACVNPNEDKSPGGSQSEGQPVYTDRPFLQEFSVKFLIDKSLPQLSLSALSVNRDEQIRILSDRGVMVPDNGSLFYPGGLTADVSYPQLLPKKISSLGTYRDQTVYLDNQQLFSNAWAGKLQIDHGMPLAHMFAGGEDFHFLIYDGTVLAYFKPTGEKIWSGSYKGLRQIQYCEKRKSFLLVSEESVAEYLPGQTVKELYSGKGITCAVPWNGDKIIVGTTSGYLFLPDKELITKLPCAEITTIREIGGQLWFGSSNGAFRLNEEGKYSYYAGERWLPGNHVIALEKGPDQSVLILTDLGLGQISAKNMTLEEKALFFEKQVRQKNIRYGFNCSSVGLVNGYSSAQTGAQPSDNLWTSMYLASQLYRFKVTGSEEAKQNAYESFEAMERLFTVTNIQGLFARSFERDYIVNKVRKPGWEEKELLSGSPESLWLPAADHANWTWRSTASSDQTVGQLFALTTILELADDPEWKARALKCMDNLMGYIVKNDLYLIDVDGQPTLWGKWNPAYVNNFPVNVGDRKLNSSNIIAFFANGIPFYRKGTIQKQSHRTDGKTGVP